MKYRLRYSDMALQDIEDLRFVIRDTYKAPLTAARYVQGLYDEINRLSTLAESLSIQTSPFFLRYGNHVRRINYKKVAIIYTVHNNIVYIHRIMASNLIESL
ncbi:MAG TPA: type II toxin-antitoxin system RelE/ParE family toxin [Petrimonas sp.]|uniref:type II toxin-antitoxin system RelE/ParE family toxin n=1 Tax=Petrimonas sp. TaxID=2023866 RepID=UPI0017576658|nr:type II toxin-antitoxin system RelE/ParE family toxin [Petrimonas sp.]